MRSSFAWVLLALTWSRGASLCAQQTDSTARDTTLETGISAGESEAEPPRRSLVKWNEYDGPFLTLRVGAGFLLDYATYGQDAAAKEQLDLEPGFKIRDSRLLISGRIKTKRRLTYQAGFMYDGYVDEWFVRQTGLMLGVPELWGNFWIGRSKEGPSLNKVMTGYDGWTAERFTFSDAIPLLSDGIKWLGYLPNRHLIWNLGVFTDWLSKDESFSYFHQAVAGRLAWVPMVSDSAGKLIHIGASFHIGKPENDTLQLKAKPEASDAPSFIDTGKFHSTSATLSGIRGVLPPGSLAVRHRVLLGEGQLTGNRRPRLSRRRHLRQLADHGRDPLLQHGGRLLQAGVTEENGVRGRAGGGGGPAAVLLQRLQWRDPAGRNLLAADSHGQLAPGRLPPAGAHLRLRQARSVCPEGQHPVFPEPAADGVLTAPATPAAVYRPTY